MAFDPLTAALGIGDKLIGHFFPDKAQQDAAKLQLLQLAQNGELAQMTGQMEINKVEAASPSLLVAGGRPFIIWVGGVGLAINYIVGPLLTWGSTIAGHPTGFPMANLSALMGIIMPVLGLGAYRTYEKVNDVVGKH